MKMKNLLRYGLICLLLQSVFPIVASAQYCTPTFIIGCAFGPLPIDDINTFSITGAASTMINDVNTGCVGTGAYDNRTTESVTLVQGTSYTASINSSASGDNTQIYIDFDNSFSFSAAESVGGMNGIASTPALSSVTVTIPAGAATGSHRMRVIVNADGAYPTLDPCAALTSGYGSGEVHDYTVVITGLSTACAAVTGLAASSITTTSAVISWTAVTGAIGYEWAINTSPTPPASGTATTLTSVSAPGLTASTAYYAHVRTKCSATSFSAWTDIPFTTLATGACAPVTGLTMSSITAASAVLNWTAVTGAAGYEWVVNTTAADPTTAGTATTATTATATGLTASTTYYAHVRTNCGTTFSAWTTVSFTTTGTTTTCPPVTGLTASSITASSAIISWTAVAGSPGYKYVINTTAADPTTSGTATTLTTTTATGLAAATIYYAHVRDSCGPGSLSTWVTIPFTTLSASCAAVTGLAASAITTSGATISWTAVTGSVGYVYVVNNTVTPPASAGGTFTTLTTASITGLTAGTTYYAHVRDSCSAGSVSAWVTIPISTLSASGCNAVTTLTATGITTTAATINWTRATGAPAVEYIVDIIAADPTTAGTGTTATSTVATGLTAATTYYAHVRDSCGATSLSAWVTIPLTTLSLTAGIINVANAGEITIAAFPNPVSDELTVNITGIIDGKAELQMSDITGKVVRAMSNIGSVSSVDMRGLPKGLYLLRYTDATNRQTIKISKQ
jgi:hypothetical protein